MVGARHAKGPGEEGEEAPEEAKPSDTEIGLVDGVGGLVVLVKEKGRDR